MYKALICSCNQLSTSATLLIWSWSTFYLSSFINGIIWHKDIQSGWKACAGTSLCLSAAQRLYAQARCCNRLLLTLCLFLVDKEGEVICAGLAHSERESWLKLPYICQGPRACLGRNSTSDQIMHYNLLTFSNLCGPALTLIEIFLNIIRFKREKVSNYTYVYILYKYLCGLSS